jgi:hypothetical protein
MISSSFTDRLASPSILVEFPKGKPVRAKCHRESSPTDSRSRSLDRPRSSPSFSSMQSIRALFLAKPRSMLELWLCRFSVFGQRGPDRRVPVRRILFRESISDVAVQMQIHRAGLGDGSMPAPHGFCFKMNFSRARRVSSRRLSYG